MSDYCNICKVNFGDPGYHGCGPSAKEWDRHYDHLLPISLLKQPIKLINELENTKTNYTLHNKDTRCSCGTCGDECGLLMPLGGPQAGAGFVICWNCQSVGELGKEPVPII